MVGGQKIKTYDDRMGKAFKYYSLISILHSYNLTKKQIQLLSFTAIRGTITPPQARKDFQAQFKCPEASINNLKSQLTKKGLLIKDNGQHRVWPKIKPDFSLDIILQTHMNGQNTETSDNKDSN